MKKGILNTKNNLFVKEMFSTCSQDMPFCNVKHIVSSAETARFRRRFSTFFSMLIISTLQGGLDLSAGIINNHRLTPNN